MWIFGRLWGVSFHASLRPPQNPHGWGGTSHTDMHHQGQPPPVPCVLVRGGFLRVSLSRLKYQPMQGSARPEAQRKAKRYGKGGNLAPQRPQLCRNPRRAVVRAQGSETRKMRFGGAAAHICVRARARTCTRPRRLHAVHGHPPGARKCGVCVQIGIAWGCLRRFRVCAQVLPWPVRAQMGPKCLRACACSRPRRVRAVHLRPPGAGGCGRCV